jgi:transcriptional regulator with XRE-family HTH domain
MYTRLIERKKELGLSNKDIEKGTGASERTVARIFSATEKDYKRGCSVDTLRSILNFLGLSFEEVFDDTKAFIGGVALADMQKKVEELTAAKDTLIAEKETLLAENTLLNDEVKALNARVELLTMQLSYKDEIIALHKIIVQERNK